MITNITTSEHVARIPNGYYTWDETCACGVQIHKSGDMWASSKPETSVRTCLHCLRKQLDKEDSS